MGKVIINKTDATKTASKSSPAEAKRESQPRERAHLDLSRSSRQAESDGVKVSTKPKATAKVESKSTPAKSTTKKSDTKKITVKAEDSSTKAVVRTVKPGSKTPAKISKYAKDTAPVQIIAREKPKQLGAGAKPTSAEMGLAVRKNRTIDPELALMASRSRAMEKTKITSHSSSARSMSGMLAERPAARARTNNTLQSHSSSKNTKAPVEESAGFTKAKSALIGVGVALVVAVVGFAGIAIFGNNKNMCTVQFESNGGSPIEGVEFVCGRTISQPADPTKDGFTFEGWIYEGDPFTFDTEIYKNATLVAKWKAEDGVEVVTVKFDTDGGSIIKDIELAKGRKLTPPSAPTKIGYVFEDWYLGDNLYDFDQPVEENITLKAKWERRDASGDGNSKPNRATGLTASKNDLTIEVGKSESITISVLPSTADYSLAATSSSDAVECSVNKATVTCAAKKAGTATVKVRDVNSGNAVIIKVSVPENDIPPVTEPEEPEQPPVEDPNPPQPPQPQTYTFTIYYKYADGTEARAPEVITLKQGESYKADVPVIEGYTSDHNTVGTDEGGIQSNISATIIYTRVAASTPDPEPTPETPPEGE